MWRYLIYLHVLQQKEKYKCLNHNVILQCNNTQGHLETQNWFCKIKKKTNTNLDGQGVGSELGKNREGKDSNISNNNFIYLN